MAMMVQSHMYQWLHRGESQPSTPHTDANGFAKLGEKRRVAVFDATNTTINRRRALADRARQEKVFH